MNNTIYGEKLQQTVKEQIKELHTSGVPLEVVAELICASLKASEDLEGYIIQDVASYYKANKQNYVMTEEEVEAILNPPPSIHDEHIIDTLNETSNALRFLDVVEGKGKFINEIGKWVFWNGSKWEADDNGLAQRKFKQVITQLKVGKAELMKEMMDASDKEKKEIGKMIASVNSWIKSSQNKSTMMNSIALAAFEEGITVPYNQFDYKGQFFGAANGIVDLRTGEIKNGDPSYLMMRSSPIKYDREALCPNWEKFLNEIMLGDETKVEFLQQIAGSALVGNLKEKMFVFQGGGNNGKSTFMKILDTVLGDTANGGYATSIAPEVIVGKINTPEYFLANLKGARAITMNETEQGGILNDIIVKRAVDTPKGLNARVVRGEAFEIVCVGTMMLLTNYIPKVVVSDEGTWRRLVLVKFPLSLEPNEVDRTLFERKLLPEVEGILNWCVKGAIKYFANGQKFIIPAIVASDTLEWRKGEDKLGTFLEYKCAKHFNSKTKGTDFVKAFSEWCRENNYHPAGWKEIKKQLMNKGLEITNQSSGGVDWIQGLNINPLGIQGNNQDRANRGNSDINSNLIDFTSHNKPLK